MPRLTLDLSDEVNKELDRIAKANCISKAEAMRRAFALLAVAESEKKRGNSLGIVREDPNSHHLEALGRVVGV
ncbi:ribbon-helix-helix protein, CopG family [Zooshikella marina]|uniref:Ribbon-helix-helix protein, CopG family n=1 Tax=Zooshikella ganghwensis TaxID=202772 RepID=A0A4V1IMT9_9GAMM|nr:ribbon-helix-helix protein, CopG family [Zooshikella ganghwensis]MBU2709341.1 ribbon-helix-helix protein, CopG family [Zooshikella ganghwensis]RDH41391.1 ribbon-helix-helix protein, CopG family [Zooshikella ganghwensis]RDH41452.1 ribbon-helix-helix protein, CopG family [Zooshikella ganghwensis]